MGGAASGGCVNGCVDRSVGGCVDGWAGGCVDEPLGGSARPRYHGKAKHIWPNTCTSGKVAGRRQSARMIEGALPFVSIFAVSVPPLSIRV